MISLTSRSGHPIAINPMTVFHIEGSGDGTCITSGSGTQIHVRESFAEVERRLKAWVKG